MSTLSSEPTVSTPRHTVWSPWISALLIGAFVSVFNIKRFGAWEQVTELWESGASPLLLAVTGHPHFFRFLTAYPGFVLEELYPTIGFSLYVSIFFAANVAMWRSISFLTANRTPALGPWVVFLCAHFFMNGRGVIAWTGWLLCVLLCLRLTRGETGGVKPLLLAVVSCWLSAVSTGVFIVVVMALLLFFVQYRRKSSGNVFRKSIMLVIGAPLMFIVGQYLVLAVNKNIEFFGGGMKGLINMLAHGVGRVLFGSEILAVLIVSFAAFLFLLLVMLVRMRKRPFKPLEKLISYATFGGLFGLTVLTLAVPLVLLYRQAGRAAPAAPPLRLAEGPLEIHGGNG